MISCLKQCFYHSFPGLAYACSFNLTSSFYSITCAGIISLISLYKFASQQEISNNLINRLKGLVANIH